MPSGGARRPTRFVVALAAIFCMLVPGLTPASSRPGRLDAATAARLTYCTGRVTLVDDGDTVNVKLTSPCPGGHKGHLLVVRNAAIQSTEIAHPKQRTAAECWSDDAAAFLKSVLKRGSTVRLASYGATLNNSKDEAGHDRYIKYIDLVVHDHGHVRYVDVDLYEIAFGLAVWKTEQVETARQPAYIAAQSFAIANHLNIWGDPGKCGRKYSPNAKLRAWTVWKTDGPDTKANAGTESLKIRNIGSTAVDLSHWELRDSSHRLYRGTETYLKIPKHVVLQSGQTLTVSPTTGKNRAGSHHLYLDSPRLPYFGNAPMGHYDPSTNPTGHGAHPTGDVYANGIYLLDPLGNFRAWSYYPCLTACSAPDLAITDLQYQDRYNQSVTITNEGQSAVPLDGIVFEANGSVRNLDTGRVLAPGASLQIAVQGAGPDTDSVENWAQPVGKFGQHGETVWLRTADDVTIAVYKYGDGGHYDYFK